ncbi:OmpA family protein [Pedobacter agri]|uniref:OmpA family protein n=1 Tax=Pedobacter agri TaxID=454586 RepID=UPI00292D8F4E|nr:OmpA family protein [Pedobacter agri]
MPQIDAKLIDEFLYTELKGRGFSIDVDDYVVTAQIVEALKNNTTDADRLKFVLAALVCRNADEQKHFYLLFDNFLKEKETKILLQQQEETELRTAAAAIQRKKTFKFLAISLLFVLVAFFVLFLLIPISKTKYLTGFDEDLIFPKQHITVGDSVQYSLKSSYPAVQKFGVKQTLHQKYFHPLVDTTGITAKWNLKDTTVQNHSDFSYAYQKTGIKPIALQITKHDRTTNLLKDTITVCDGLPVVTFDQAIKGKKIAFKIDNPENRAVVWKIDGKAVTGGNRELDYTFDSVRVYQLNCRYLDQFCPHDSVGIIAVNVIDANQFTVSNSQMGNIKSAVTPKLKSLFYWSYDIIGFFLILMILTYSIPRLYRKYENTQLGFPSIYSGKETQYLKNVELPDFTGSKEPLDIQFNNKNKLIRGKEAIVKMAFNLKRKIESDQYYLNLKKTSLATIRNLGMFTPVLQNKSSKRSYLVLIDKTHEKNVGFKLFQYLVSQLLSHQVDLDIYYYYKSPLRVFKKHIDDSVNINYLKNQYHQSILMIFGDGHNFIDAVLPEINAEIEHAFSFWPSRLLLTSIPVLDWSLNEKILGKFFHLLPADNIGLLKTVEVLLKKEYKQVKDTHVLKNYSANFIEFEEIGELDEYLHNEKMLQWIAAIALYPKVTWEIILAIGDRLDNELVTYENLLKICRIDWIQKGIFPSRIRLELLKRLTIENEIIARETLVNLLEGETEVEPGSFASNERRLQLIVNKFVLYTHNAQKYSAFGPVEKEFLLLYNQQKLRDIPLNIYLKGIDPDHKNDTWENTLRNRDNKIDNLEAYSNQKLGITPKEEIRKKIRSNLLQAIIILGFLFASLTIVGFVKPNFSMLVNTETKAIQNWKIAFQKDSCYKIFNPNRLVMAAGSKTIFDTVLVNRDSIHLNNLPSVAGKEIRFTFISSAGLEAATSMVISSDQVKLQISGNCREVIPGNPVYLRYYPEGLKDSVVLFQVQLQAEKYAVNNTLDLELTAKSEVRYALDADRKRAVKVASDASLFFKRDIQAVKVESTHENQIEVWMLGKSLPTIVNIQYNDLTQKTFATRLQRSLQKSGYKVEEIVQGAFDWGNEVRYYDDNKRGEAVAILKIVRNGTLGEMTTKKLQLSLPEKDKNIIKVWLKNLQDPTSCKSYMSNNGATIYFKTGENTVSSESQGILDQLTKKLMDSPSGNISVRGYSNSEKTAMQNLVQAKEFANAVKTYLVKNGIAESSINTISDSEVTRAIKNPCDDKVVISISTSSSKKKSNRKMPNNKY